MLGHNDVVATIPVVDMKKSRKFYEDVLGLVPTGTIADLAITYNAGDTQIFVYEASHPVTPSVVATWAVEDEIELLVAGLKDKGIVFEQFEREGFEPHGDIYQAASFKVAVFKDPDGNMLSLYQPEL